MPIKLKPIQYAHTEGHTDVCFSADGNKFITCGTDGDIRICAAKELDYPVNCCVGEWALCVRQNGSNIYVTTSGNDVQILTYPEGERIKVLERSTAPINHIAINNDGTYIALAGEDMEVKVIKVEDDIEMKTFDGPQGPCLSVAFSHSSEYLAASAGDGNLRVWNLKTDTLLKTIKCFPKVNSFSNAKNLCRIDFHPKNELLAYPEKNKIIILNVKNWETCSELKDENICEDFSIVQFSPCGRYLAATALKHLIVWNLMTKTIFDHIEHPNSSTFCGLMWHPQNHGHIIFSDTEGYYGMAHGCCDGSLDDTSTPIPSTSKEMEGGDDNAADDDDDNPVDFTGVEFEDDGDNNDDDGENVVSVEKLKQQYQTDIDPEVGTEAPSSRSTTPRPRTPEVPMQEPFMPSSSPEHLDLRYLCWNEVGIIKAYNTVDVNQGKSIEIEFHDTMFHNGMNIPNFQEYFMASVSKSAIVVANLNQINVIPIFGGSKEWHFKIDEPEEILLIASSENLICIVTNNNILRILSIHGTQRGVATIPGPIITITAYKSYILLAYHSAGPRKKDQCVNFKLIKTDGFTVEAKDLFSALSPEATIRWLGFTDYGTPAVLDSAGLLSLFPANCGIWIPFCDVRKHLKNPSDSFFVTGVFEKYQSLCGVKCKGTLYPGFTPRPTVCELPLEPPFGEQGTEKTQWEMNLFTWSNLRVQDTERKFKEIGLKTFVLASKNNLDQRAIEVVELLGDPQIITLATKYANKVDKRRLAEKLMEVAEKLTKNTTEELKDESKPEEIKIMPLKMTPKMKISKKSEQKPETPISQCSTIDLTPTIDSPNIENVQELKKNPFLKKKNVIENDNPLSLSDKYAGFEYKEPEKRKSECSPVEKKATKQRKIDLFSFKRS